MATQFHTTNFYVANLKTVPVLGARYWILSWGRVTNLGCEACGDVPTYKVNFRVRKVLQGYNFGLGTCTRLKYFLTG